MIFVYIFSIITGFSGLTVSLILLLNLKVNRIINHYFIAFLSVISIKQILVGIGFIQMKENTMIYLFEYSNFSVLGLPLIYLYLKKLFKNKNSFKAKELVEIIIIPCCFFLIIFKIIESSIHKKSNIHFELILNILPLVFSIYYAYLCFKKISKEIWSKNDTLITKKQNKIITDWTIVLFIAILIPPLKFFIIRCKVNQHILMNYIP